MYARGVPLPVPTGTCRNTTRCRLAGGGGGMLWAPGARPVQPVQPVQRHRAAGAHTGTGARPHSAPDMWLRGTQWTMITVWIIAATSGRRSHAQALQPPADSDGGGDSGGLPVKPERCYGTDDILERHCCVFPPFYSRAVSRACGAATELLQQRAAPAQGRRTAGTGPAGNITALRRRTPHGDEYWPCVLRRYGLTAGAGGAGEGGGEEETVSLESLGAHLSRWAARHPAFRLAVRSAARRCRRMYRPLLPLHAGHYGLLHTCLRTHINMDCPSSVDDPGCRLQKAFYDECRQYFI